MQEGPLLTDTSQDTSGKAGTPIKPDLTDLSDLIEDRTASPFGSEVASVLLRESYFKLLQHTIRNGLR